MVREKEEQRKSAQKEDEQRSVQTAVGKLKKQASVEKGTPALGRGAGWEGSGGAGKEGRCMRPISEIIGIKCARQIFIHC